MNFSVNALVAQHVFRREIKWVDAIPLQRVVDEFVEIPDYERDSSQAMLVVEKMRNRGFVFGVCRKPESFGVTFFRSHKELTEHKEFSRAVCMGALAVLGIDFRQELLKAS